MKNENNNERQHVYRFDDGFYKFKNIDACLFCYILGASYEFDIENGFIELKEKFRNLLQYRGFPKQFKKAILLILARLHPDKINSLKQGREIYLHLAYKKKSFGYYIQNKFDGYFSDNDIILLLAKLMTQTIEPLLILEYGNVHSSSIGEDDYLELFRFIDVFVNKNYIYPSPEQPRMNGIINENDIRFGGIQSEEIRKARAEVKEGIKGEVSVSLSGIMLICFVGVSAILILNGPSALIGNIGIGIEAINKLAKSALVPPFNVTPIIESVFEEIRLSSDNPVYFQYIEELYTYLEEHAAVLHSHFEAHATELYTYLGEHAAGLYSSLHNNSFEIAMFSGFATFVTVNALLFYHLPPPEIVCSIAIFNPGVIPMYYMGYALFTLGSMIASSINETFSENNDKNLLNNVNQIQPKIDPDSFKKTVVYTISANANLGKNIENTEDEIRIAAARLEADKLSNNEQQLIFTAETNAANNPVDDVCIKLRSGGPGL